MARAIKKKPVQRVVKKRNTGLSHAEALADNYVVVRWATEEEGVDMEERLGFVTPVTPELAYTAEHLALMKQRRWRAITITFCQGNDGKPYRLIAYGVTKQPIAAWREGIKPFIRLLLQESERSLNPNHLQARATLFAPLGPHSAPIERLLASQRKALHIEQEDIDAVAAMSKEDPHTSFSYDQFEALELDDKLHVLFTEQRLEGI